MIIIKIRIMIIAILWIMIIMVIMIMIRRIVRIMIMIIHELKVMPSPKKLAWRSGELGRCWPEMRRMVRTTS